MDTTHKKVLKLIVLSEIGFDDEYSIANNRKTLIGRGETANIQISNDCLASREHCLIYYTDSNFVILDLDSANGTQLNQENINSNTLKENDLITVGNTLFRVKLEANTQAPLALNETEMLAEEQSVVETPKKPEFCLFESLEKDSEQEESPTNIDNQSSFKIKTLLWPDFNGKSALCIIAKATYKIEAGEEPKPSDKKIPIFDQTVFFKDNISIMYETDLVPFKPLTDIVVVGKAYTPDKQPLKKLDVGIKVGEIQQIIRVFGDRSWYLPEVEVDTDTDTDTDTDDSAGGDGVFIISEPEDFTSIELKYENAFGGSDIENEVYCRENPIGHGCIVEQSLQNSELRKLPNFENPLDLIETCESRPSPVGFGFCSLVWAPRIDFMGSHKEDLPEGKPLYLPDNFSYQFFNGAHPNLQVEGYLKGDEQVALVNLSATGKLVFQLPKVKPEVVVSKKSSSTENIKSTECDKSHIEMNLDTLVFIPEENVFYQVFRGMLLLDSMEDIQKLTIQVRALEQ